MVERTYPEPDPDEGYLYIRELEDHRLVDEFEFLAPLFHAVCAEIAFRADNPEIRDDTGDITAEDVALYEVADEVADHADLDRQPRTE